MQPPTAKARCHLRALQNAESFLNKAYEHTMKCTLNSSGIELHPAQKANLRGEGTAEEIDNSMVLSVPC